MRKIISIAAIVMLAGMFTSPVSAGQEESDICEPLKDATKGLYGLCIAYYNTSSESNRARIEAKYLELGGDPYFVPGEVKPSPGEGSCACWTQDQFLAAWESQAVVCLLTENGISATFLNPMTFFVLRSQSCEFRVMSEGVDIDVQLQIDGDQEEQCLDSFQIFLDGSENLELDPIFDEDCLPL